MAGEVLFVRHGESEDLAARIRSRRSTPLTERGRQEARLSARVLRNLNLVPDLIVVSPLPRTVQTSEEIVDELGYTGEIWRDPGLVEREWGILAGQPNDKVVEALEGDYRNFDTVQGAETIEALQERAQRRLGRLATIDVPRLLIVGHGTWGRAAVRSLQDQPYTDEYDVPILHFKTGEVIRFTPSVERLQPPDFEAEDKLRVE